MSDRVIVRLDIRRLHAALSARAGAPLSPDDVLVWLMARGFVRERDGFSCVGDPRQHLDDEMILDERLA